MIHTTIQKDRAVPIWAAIGAPLVGVPLLVALLSLTAPEPMAPSVEPGVSVVPEQVEVLPAEQTIDATEQEGGPLQRG